MLKHYFKTALRALLRKKLYTIINVFGLAIGLALCLTVLGHISYEFSFEDIHENKDRIYRVECDYAFEDEQWSSARVMAPLGNALADELPEVEKAAVFRVGQVRSVKVGDERFMVVDEYEGAGYAHHNKLIFADPSYLEVFTFPLAEGNPATALIEPFSVLITERTVQQYFPNRQPVGQILTINDSLECLVTGILKDIPQNTQLHCDFIISYATLSRLHEEADSWNQFAGDYAYLLLGRGANADSAAARIAGIAGKYLEPRDAPKYGFRLKALKDIYFRVYGSGVYGELYPAGEASVIYAFGSIAVFILLVAVANFINLSTAKSTDRTKEVGVRKVFGAHKSHLISQFLGESIIIAVVAMIISIGLYEFLKVTVEGYLPREMMVDFYNDPMMLASVVGLILIVGIIAGYYPSLYLSRFNPITVIHGKTRARSSKSFLRRALVVFQFGVAAVFIFVTQAIVRQTVHVTAMDLGFDHENMMILDFEGEEAANDCQLVKNELLAKTDIISATATDAPPGKEGYRYYGFMVVEPGEDTIFISTRAFSVDGDFISQFGLQLVDGTPFTDEMVSGSDNVVIVTESLVKKAEWQNPIGSRLLQRNEKSYEVVGVVKDFLGTQTDFGHRSEIVLMFRPEERTSLVVELPPTNVAASIAAVRDVWQETLPGYEFTYSFLDETIDKNYDELRSQSRMFSLLALFAIGIASLGIFGLVSYTAEQRTKEIGIRKVLGASVPSIVQLLSKEFAILVVLANVIGLPIGYLLVKDFLSWEAFPISIGPFSYILVCLGAVGFALGTASFQSIRAGLANPVDTLRSE
ncbi:MAG: ABC transporter permease [Candidatus Zixiibacteriota bacterium]|nr:MAG: ABC transporter permease [candidate division Zixibacteria bacterium]